jgi:hypothetical protein
MLDSGGIQMSFCTKVAFRYEALGMTRQKRMTPNANEEGSKVVTIKFVSGWKPMWFIGMTLVTDTIQPSVSN